MIRYIIVDMITSCFLRYVLPAFRPSHEHRRREGMARSAAGQLDGRDDGVDATISCSRCSSLGSDPRDGRTWVIGFVYGPIPINIMTASGVDN